MSAPLRRVVQLLIALSAGLLIGSGAIVAPVVFDQLATDHLTAGRIAGQVFQITYLVTLVVALIAVLSGVRRGKQGLMAVSMLLMSGLLVGVIVPAIAHHGQGWPFSFAALHGSAGGLHMLLILLGVTLAWQLGVEDPAAKDR